MQAYLGQFLGYADADATEMRIRVCVINARGEGVPGTQVEISAYDWQAEPGVTDAEGCCPFAGLTRQLDYASLT